MDNSRPLPKSSRRAAPRQRSRRAAAAAVAAAWLASAAGCSGGEAASFAVRLVGPPAVADGACPALAEPAPPELGSDAPDLLRLTYRRPDGGPLVCDVVLPLDGENRTVALPGSAGGEPVDVYAELFRGDPAGAVLSAAGAALGVLPESGATVSIHVRPREAFSCAPEPANSSRAFHSATPLPGGDVLLVGGLAAGGEGEAAGGGAIDLDAEAPFFAVSGADLYDAATGEFHEVSVPGLTARAFHRAVLLGDRGDGLLRVALLGGLTVHGDPRESPAARFGGDGEQLRIMPAAAAAPAPAEVIVLDPASAAAELAEEAAGPAPRFFAAAGGAPRPVLAGGLGEGASADLSFEVLDPETAASQGSFPLRAARVGATASDLGAGRLLLYGGNLESDDADRAAEAAEVVSGLGAGDAAASALLAPGGGSDPPAPRAFHAAAAGGAGEVLLAGGFAIAGGRARAPQDRFAQLFTDGSPPALTDVVVLGGVRAPAGYLEAAPLPGDDVLVSGGNPALGHAGCPREAAGLACALGGAYRYRRAEGALDPVGDLAIPRYGHRMTPLPDGTILVTGGLGAGAGGFRVLSDAEVFQPRTEATDPIADLEHAREPGDVARGPDGDPVAECPVVE